MRLINKSIPGSILSFFSLKTFNLLSVILIFSAAVYAKDSVKPVKLSVKSPDKITIQTGFSYMVPVGKSSKAWSPCVLSGISFKLPSIHEFFRIEFGLDAGRISARKGAGLSSSYNRVYIYKTSIVVSSTLNIKDEYEISPFLGISRIRIDPYPDENTVKNMFRIPSLENEFGLLAGIAPSWRVKKLVISLPLTLNRVLSSPERFSSFSFSIYAGGSF